MNNNKKNTLVLKLAQEEDEEDELFNYSYLFRKNTHKLALRSYKGSKKSVLGLFNLYSNIVDIRSGTFSETLMNSFDEWTSIVREQSQQFTPDEKVTTDIRISLKSIASFLKHTEIDLKNKIELYKSVRYHNLVKDLVSYIISFFDHLGIKVKPLPLVSDITGIKVIGFTLDEKEDKPFKKLNEVKDSNISVEFVAKMSRMYRTEMSKLLSDKKKVTSDTLHKLTGLSIISNISSGTYISLDITEDEYDHQINNEITIPGIGTIIRTIYFNKKREPEFIDNSLFKTEKCLPEGLGSRIFAQQVKTASELGFEYISTLAAGHKGSDNVGYYVWPKLGYDTIIDKDDFETRIRKAKDEIKYNYLENWLYKNTNYKGAMKLSDIYACKAGDRFIGQELWYKYGGTTGMEFDLTPGSLSMRILESYINLKCKKDNIDPSEFLNINYSKYNSLDLECYLDKGGDSSTIANAIKHNIKNYENGVLEKIYRNPNTREKFLKLLSWVPGIDQDNKDRIKEILEYKGFNNVKLASGYSSEDPILKELDMDILDQIWTGISKQYK